MDKMTDARAVEVLAAMREDGGVVADADYTAAIDRAVARLREPAEAHEDEVVCLECGQPTMHMGQVCYACSHPAAKPAEAQAQGGGDVYGYEHDGRYWSRDGATPWVIHHAVPLYTAPKSAPVGVKAYPLWQAIHAASEKAGFTCNVGLSQVADALADLAQQPSPVAPVGVERLVVAARKLRDSARGMDDGNRWVPGAVFKQFSKAVTAALAQQPAVVDGADQ